MSSEIENVNKAKSKFSFKSRKGRGSHENISFFLCSGAMLFEIRINQTLTKGQFIIAILAIVGTVGVSVGIGYGIVSDNSEKVRTVIKIALLTHVL